MELLGVTISRDGLGMEEKKVTAIQDWPLPTNLKEMKGFIRFCNFYCRFLKNFAIIAQPLHDLNKKGLPWKWGPPQQQAFEQLKELIAAEPCLKQLELDKPFWMESDASAFAYGAALSQKQRNGRYLPVALMLKSMIPAERNYDAYDREALGIVKPLQQWRYWLQGTQKPIKIITDHKNLLSGFNNKPTPSKRHLRWLEILQHYNYIVGYHPSKQNSVADTLSRRSDHWESAGQPVDFKPFSEERMIPLEELELAALGLGLEPEEWDKAMEWAFCNMISTDGTLIEEIRRVTRDTDLKGDNGRIWVLDREDLRWKIVELYHDTPITGHLGIAGTYELVTRGYQWEGIHEYITNYVHGCTTCIRAKKRNYKLHGVLKPLPIPEGPWQWMESDHIVKLPKSKGKDAIYVVVNHFTKMAHFIPTTEKTGEDNLVDLHMKHVWKLHGIPLIHSTNRHGTFTSRVTRKMFKALGIEQ